MKVFGHDHVTQHHEAITLPYLVQNSKKQVTAARMAEDRLAAVTAAGDEMQVLGAVESVQALGHDVRIVSGEGDPVCDGARPFAKKRERTGHPQVL